jgi:hypothetical protein
MKTQTLDKWIWGLVYAGMAAFGLGLAVARQDTDIGHPVAIVGAVLALLGVVLVVVRSRMSDETTNERPGAKEQP